MVATIIATSQWPGSWTNWMRTDAVDAMVELRIRCSKKSTYMNFYRNWSRVMKSETVSFFKRFFFFANKMKKINYENNHNDFFLNGLRAHGSVFIECVEPQCGAHENFFAHMAIVHLTNNTHQQHEQKSETDKKREKNEKSWSWRYRKRGK